MIWHKDLFDKEKEPTFSPIGISPDMENEFYFFKMMEREPPRFLKHWLTYFEEKGIQFKPQYLKAINRQIKMGDFLNPHKFPDYFDNEFDFISISFKLGYIANEIVCSLGLAFVKKGEPVNWTSYYVIPPGEDEVIVLPRKNIVGAHEIKHAHNFKNLWDDTLSELITNNLLVFYDSVTDLNILKTLLLNYNIENFDFWYADVLSTVELSGNSERLAELKELGMKIKKEEDVEEDAVAFANVFHELTKVYPSYRDHVRHLSGGNS